MSAAETFLQPDEIHEITDKVRWSAQCRALSRMGVPFEPNAVGRPLVERAAYLKHDRTISRKAAEPDWGKLNGKAA